MNLFNNLEGQCNWCKCQEVLEIQEADPTQCLQGREVIMYHRDNYSMTPCLQVSCLRLGHLLTPVIPHPPRPTHSFILSLSLQHTFHLTQEIHLGGHVGHKHAHQPSQEECNVLKSRFFRLLYICKQRPLCISVTTCKQRPMCISVTTCKQRPLCISVTTCKQGPLCIFVTTH